MGNWEYENLPYPEVMSTSQPPRNQRPRSALIVFAKPPVAGQVKTRMTNLLSEDEAARLYEAFLRDALAQHAALGADVRLYHTAGVWPERLTPAGASLHAQCGDGLGARMKNAFAETFAAGYRRVLIVGTDHPTLPAVFVEQGFAALKGEQSVCLGPSADGGYYLLGLRRPFPSLFEEMTYSHARVFEETLARAARAGAVPTVLPEWYDVDTPADLRRLAADLDGSAPARAPHTRCALRRLAEKHPSLRP